MENNSEKFNDSLEPKASENGIDGASASEEEAVLPNARAVNVFWATIAGVLMLTVVMMLSGGLDSLARDFMRFFEPVGAGTVGIESAGTEGPSAARPGYLAFEELDIHPDVVFRPYTAGQLIAGDVSSATGRMIREFRDLLDLYEQRQGVDDNFTIRVVDNRSDDLLELYEFEEERASYENLSSNEGYNWGRIDEMRRTATRRLVDKWAARGVPRPAITVKWGRRNQVLQARDREEGFIEYEVRLARFLGLSLLATEIGTVETFNDDRLVSPVGARSRYQMMPYVLRQNDIHHYRVATAAGNGIEVYEEWQPLLTMEAALTTAAGYIHAAGHEIPGISAYHTGPGNIYMVYRMFLTEATSLFSEDSSVMDAYMWAVTTGYDEVSRNSSFKSYSRGYVASAYGALRATQSLPIDTSKTVKAERVQVKPGEKIFLSEILRALEGHDESLLWVPGTEEFGLYNKFRALNKHFVLPGASDEATGVAPNADVAFVSESQGVPVRFFLPLGASRILEEAGVHALDESKRFVFNHDTWGRPDPSEVTIWDRQYEDLVRDVANFGFNNDLRRRLIYLVDRFEELAESRPSHYRQTQLEVIKTHERIWRSNVFDRLASAVSAARGRIRVEGRPPSELPTSDGS